MLPCHSQRELLPVPPSARRDGARTRYGLSPRTRHAVLQSCEPAADQRNAADREHDGRCCHTRVHLETLTLAQPKQACSHRSAGVRGYLRGQIGRWRTERFSPGETRELDRMKERNVQWLSMPVEFSPEVPIENSPRRYASIAPVATRRHDRGKRVEAEFDDGLQGFGGDAVSETLGQGVVPGGILGLQGEQFDDRIMPALRP